MRVRWLGNACLEIFGDDHILIDPHFTVTPENEADLVLVTHEHDDHFDPAKYRGYGEDAGLYAPATTLEKFGVDGHAVTPGDRIGDVRVLDCDCWGSDESVSYYYHGLLHAGDSNVFPDAEDVAVIFTACFPDYYEDYVSAFTRLNPTRVVPFHYDPEDNESDATGLKERLDSEGIPNEILAPGESIDV